MNAFHATPLNKIQTNFANHLTNLENHEASKAGGFLSSSTKNAFPDIMIFCLLSIMESGAKDSFLVFRLICITKTN